MSLDGTSWRHVRVQPIMGVNVNDCNDCGTARDIGKGELLMYPRMAAVVPKSCARRWARSSHLPEVFRSTGEGAVKRSFGYVQVSLRDDNLEKQMEAYDRGA